MSPRVSDLYLAGYTYWVTTLSDMIITEVIETVQKIFKFLDRINRLSHFWAYDFESL